MLQSSLLLRAGGVGRRVGEQMEHLWSRGKPLFLVARYMTPAHWWDSMNALLELLTTLLQHELPKLLSSSWRTSARASVSVAETAGTSEAGTGRQAGLQLAHAVLYALLFSSQLASPSSWRSWL